MGHGSVRVLHRSGGTGANRTQPSYSQVDRVLILLMSMTLAAVICDADDPCSVNTSYDPESSFRMSPRSTTPPLYF